MARNNVDEQFTTAQQLWRDGDVARSEVVLRTLVKRDPKAEQAAMLLATVLRNQGRLDEASRVVFDLCHARGFEYETGLPGAQFVQQCHRPAIALEICKAVEKQSAFTPELSVVAGNLARELGDFDSARSRYIAALDGNIDLNRHFVLGALAHTTRYIDASHPDIPRFAEHFRNAAFSGRSRASSGFGLAKAYDDLGDFQSAARVLREANALVRAVQSWSTASWNEFVVARQIGKLARRLSAPLDDFVPVFVIGLPRSGTTLTAAQLAKYSGARDRGELRALRFIADTLISGNHLGAASAIDEAARLYRAHSVQDDAPTKWYIDQDPLNFRYLDIAAAMYPQARIIECRRSRRDTALSLWSQDFAHPDTGFAYDLSDIAAYAGGYDRLMEHWRRMLPMPIYELDYDALVTDPENAVRKLCNFAGAPFGVAQSAPAPINSASVWQARQPVYTTSVGRWRSYLPFVPELEQFPE